MTFWGSCSSSWRALLVTAVACALVGCAGARPAAVQPPRFRIALLPLENLSGVSVPTRKFRVQLEVALRSKGLDIASEDILESFLARHRIRYTAGVDRATARAAREELEVDALLVGSVDLYRAVGTPLHGMTMRLVSTEDEPRILWMDGSTRAGDDSPGIFGLGLVGSVHDLERQALSRLAGSLVAYLGGKGPRVTSCPRSSRFEPRILYRSLPSRRRDRLSVAVLPFVNQTGQASAGEVVGLAFVRALAAMDWLDVRDPGVVRTELLRHRVVMEGGVSHEAARVALGSMDVDVVVSGYVRGYDGTPSVEFTALALDTWSNRIVWQSTSFNRGTDGVFFFDAGKVHTASGLACRMALNVVEEMASTWRASGRAPPAPRAQRGGGR